MHGDLHYDNILAGSRRPWLAIDPKPVTGNPERSVGELMWDRIDDATQPHEVHALFAALTRTGMLHPDRARAWTIVQAVDYWWSYFLRPMPPYSQIFDGSPSISPSGRQNGNWTTPGSTMSSPSKNRPTYSRDLSTNGAVASSYP